MALSTGFHEYIKNLDLLRTSDIAKFYKIIKSLLKYKVKSKVVKEIKVENQVLVRKIKES